MIDDHDWKAFGTNRPWGNRDNIPAFAWLNRGKSRRTKVTVAGVPAIEIRAKHLPDTSKPTRSVCMFTSRLAAD
jgi:hypothetical protein